MRAVVVSEGAPGRLAVGELPEPAQDSNQTLVRVKAVSLNRGEVRRAQSMSPGEPIGWDLAGIVERAAPDGSGPGEGQRVVGFSPAMRGWAELCALRSNALAVVPDAVSLEEASTLPVAALTALYGLERCNRLLGAKVVITGGSGGVGYFACQLAVLMGAEVYAQTRQASQVEMVAATGAQHVVVDADGSVLASMGPYRMVLDGVGGELLGKLTACLEQDGRAVTYGVSAGATTELAIRDLMGTGAGRLDGFHLYRESEIVSAGSGLARLLKLMEQGRIHTNVSRTDSWEQVGEVAQALIDRSYPGKAVLTIA